MRNKPLPGIMKDSPLKEKTYTKASKKLKRMSFGKKKGRLKKKGLSTFDFDDTVV